MGLKSNPRLGLLSPIHTLSHHPHPIENFQCIVASPTSRVVRFPFTQSQKMTFEVRRETVYNHSWSSTCQLKIFTPFPGTVWKKHVKQGLCSKFLCNLSTFREFWVESRQEYNDTSQKFRGTFKFTLRIQQNVTSKKFSENSFDNVIELVIQVTSSA